MNVYDWVRHEKEHEFTYGCNLLSQHYSTESGMKCPFCANSIPDGNHTEVHRLTDCATITGTSFTCKRRVDMVQHLQKYHSVSLLLSQVQEIASKSMFAETTKQAWACGVCGQHFTEYSNRLNHIRYHHMEAGQGRNDWHTCKVIWGLLHQRGLVHIWEARLASSGVKDEIMTEVAYSSSNLEMLEKELEIGPTHDASAVYLVDKTVSMLSRHLGNAQH